MQEKTFKSSENLKKEILGLLEQIDVLQKQSLNTFDKPEIYTRVFEYLDLLDSKFHELNRFLENPSPDESRAIQDLFFHIKKMKDVMEDLKLEPHNLKFQQPFIEGIDHIKEDLNKI